MTENELNISVVILTHNEEIHIQRCILNLQQLTKKIYIIDSFSTDKTVEIAESLGAVVLQNPWVNYAEQFQWGLDHSPIDTKWVMRFDADEILTDELVSEIKDKLPSLPSDISGVSLKRRHYFLGRWVKHGTRYPLVLLRIWHHGAAHIEQRWMDEHVVLENGSSVTFDNDFSDINLNKVEWFIEKHNKYASREMLDILNQKYHFFEQDNSLEKDDTKQVVIKRFFKEKFYNRLPIFVRPVLYFLYRYIIRLGFLDGKEGFAYHFMQGFWYRCLVDLKCLEAEKLIQDVESNEQRIKLLKELTSLKLD